MVIRDINGALHVINKYDFKNDKLYFLEIIRVLKRYKKSSF